MTSRENTTERQRNDRNLQAKRAEFLGVQKIATRNCIEKTNPGALELCSVTRRSTRNLRVKQSGFFALHHIILIPLALFLLYNYE